MNVSQKSALKVDTQVANKPKSTRQLFENQTNLNSQEHNMVDGQSISFSKLSDDQQILNINLVNMKKNQSHHVPQTSKPLSKSKTMKK